MNRPAVLLDRDGTLNTSPVDFVKSLAEFEAIPGAFEAVGRLCRAGWPVAVVTNQSCVGRGIISAEVVDQVHEECTRIAAMHGGSFEGFYVCPHAPDEGCNCRKPLPGLILSAAKKHAFDLFRSYCIGDSLRDLLAGRAAGATSLLVLSGKGEEVRADHPGHLTFPSLSEAADWILSRG